MGITISSEILAKLIAAADASPHAEICGLLLGDADRIERAEACNNVAIDPTRTFEIDPTALFAAHRHARAGASAVIGHYHSHPSGVAVPSLRDAAQAMGDGALWLILATGGARLWRSRGIGAFAEELLIPVQPTYG